MNQPPEDIKRWTARRKAAAIMEIIKGKTTAAEIARSHDLTIAEIDQWMDDFVSQGTECSVPIHEMQKPFVNAQQSTSCSFDRDLAALAPMLRGSRWFENRRGGFGSSGLEGALRVAWRAGCASFFQTPIRSRRRDLPRGGGLA